MYCSKCGTKISAFDNFCQNCGFKNNNISTISENISTSNDENKENKIIRTPVALIAISWILFALCLIDEFLDLGLAIVISIAAILCSILLIINKNRIAKVNGIVIISIWTLAFIIVVLSENIY